MKAVKFDNKVDLYKSILMAQANALEKRRFRGIRDIAINDFLSKHHSADSFIYFANKFDFSETRGKIHKRLNTGHYSVEEYTTLPESTNCLTFKKLKQMVQVAVTVTIIGIIAGGVAAFTDKTHYKTYQNTPLLDRLDRLVRAVELDWGR